MSVDRSTGPTAPTILIVEGDDAKRRGLSAAFRDQGFAVIDCADLGSAHFHIGADGMPDIALVQYALRDGAGSDLCRELRARGIPCLVMSAFPTWARDTMHPPLDWILEPFEMSVAVAAVCRRLGSGWERTVPRDARAL
jgi:DNA-binding response OmpR family regulator